VPVEALFPAQPAGRRQSLGEIVFGDRNLDDDQRRRAAGAGNAAVGPPIVAVCSSHPSGGLERTAELLRERVPLRVLPGLRRAFRGDVGRAIMPRP